MVEQPYRPSSTHVLQVPVTSLKYWRWQTRLLAQLAVEAHVPPTGTSVAVAAEVAVGGGTVGVAVRAVPQVPNEQTLEQQE